ncbi:hypothetical protein LCGC14_3120430 [marine sediment metagenome]|uniref:Uncharacterized protein n=1 Tax=marine sediment metagenome TaxID=412755 RepID=A0A0F8YSD4_9ZZZZ
MQRETLLAVIWNTEGDEPEQVAESTRARLESGELEAAGIPALDRIVPDRGEVPARIFGGLDPLGWSFNRAWYYWIAKGPGIPPSYAAELHRQHGRDVRVDGHCLAPSPLEWCKGFAVGMYHVDTPEGLKALADTIKLVHAEAQKGGKLREKFRELLEVVPRISTDGDGDTWMHAPNVGINLSAQGRLIFQKNLLIWAEKMKQATGKARAIVEGE